MLLDLDDSTPSYWIRKVWIMRVIAAVVYGDLKSLPDMKQLFDMSRYGSMCLFCLVWSGGARGSWGAHFLRH